ncbi:MAG: uroporphyrinogen decarboxylase [Terriglobia bacterium]
MTSTANLTASFEGLAVAAFESRRAGEIATLISRFGGVPRIAPSMREVPLAGNAKAMVFGEALLAGKLDVVIFMTGVGVTMLLQVLEDRHPRSVIVEALSAARVVARGSKTVRALDDAGVRIAVKVPEPNTWREVLRELGENPQAHHGLQEFDLKGARVALQEYGEPNEPLVKGLEARGADVFRVPVYRWALPEDVTPLEAVVGEMIDGQARIVLFTNAVQADHLMQFAGLRACAPELRRALHRSVTGSIGPTCSEALRKHGLAVDLEPDLHKMGILVHEAARRAPSLLRSKDAGAADSSPAAVSSRGTAAEVVGCSADLSSQSAAFPAATIAIAESNRNAALPRWHDSRFMRACRLEPVDATPVWLMRQAGRYMKEYRELRARTPFLELCKNPERVAEITVFAARRIGADAAILFADLLLIAEPMGFSLEYDRGGGPWVTPTLRSAAQIDRLREIDPRDPLGYVFEAVRRTRASLDDSVPLIGFAGAPFTLASYLIEGGGSKTFRHTKTLMFSDPGAWHALMEYLSRSIAAYINGQMEAGAGAVQIFDSWVGCLSPSLYREFVLPHMRKLFQALTPGAPVIHFGTGTGQLLELMRDAGGSVIGLDFRVELDDAWSRLGAATGVQGNLDPAVLYADVATIRERARGILRQARGQSGHIFNLGHGVLPETPVEHVADLVKIVHDESARMQR